jgi:methyl-accepting chemotaxis protein
MKFNSLNSRVGGIITLGVVISVAILIFVVSTMTNRAVFSIQEKNMQEINSVLVDELEQVVRLNLVLLKSLSVNTTFRKSIRDTNFSAYTNKQVRSLLKHFDKIEFIGGFNAAGVYSFGEDSGGKDLQGINISSRDYYKAIMSGDNYTLSKVVKGSDGEGKLFMIAVPVKDPTGKVLGGLVVGLDWEKYEQELLGKVTIGNDGYGFILDKDGTMIGHKKDKSLLLKDLTNYKFIRDILSSGSGSLQYKWEGQIKKVTFMKVPSTGWILCMSAYEHDLTSAAIGERNILIIIGAVVVILLVLILVLFIKSTVISPISRIMEFTGKIAKGDFQASLKGKYSCEFVDLSADIVSMVSELKHKLGFSEGVLNGLSIPSVVADSEEKILFVNKEMLELCDHNGKPENYIGITIGELVYGDPGRKTIAGKAISENKAQHNVEVEIKNSNGGIKETLINVSPLFDLDNELIGAFLMITDMTEIKQQQLLIESKNKQISEAAAKATSISRQVSEYSSSLASQILQTSRGAEQQRNMAEETATAMEQMNSTVLEVARNAANAAGTAEESKDKAHQGEQIVHQVVETIHRVRNMSEELQSSMADLGQQAEGIGTIMGVISDIADQTNLLALNAAIEAARAGEAGRGFAVVADEVRKLAEKTMTATNEVGGYIKSIQESARKNISNTEESTEAVNDANDLVSRSGEVLAEIVSMVSETTDQVRSIAAASEEQSAASEQISHSTERINSIAQENSAAMEESEDAVKQMSSLAVELNDVIITMQN